MRERESIPSLNSLLIVISRIRTQVSRMLKIPQLQRLLVSLIAMIPAVVDVGIVTMYLLFVYAVIGVQVFATVAYYKDYNEYVNFRSFPVALLSMFTFATDSHWDKVMPS